MKAEASPDAVVLALSRDEANAIFYLLTEFGFREDEAPAARDLWSFFEMLHQVPVEGAVVSGDFPPPSKPRRAAKR